jgi:cold shock CspA family protein/ribosome-associated translation inhibitor RaiA
MELPVQITFRNMDHSDAVETFIREKAAHLDSFYDRIIRCRVMVEVPHQRRRTGNPYHVRIDLTVPGGELAISRNGSLHTGQKQKQIEQPRKAAEIDAAHKDAYLTIRDAFDEARRQLQDHARRQRGQVKAHAVTPLGRVVRLFVAEGYGFLETPDGREIYFHKNSVLTHSFDHLKIGTEVSFVEEEGEKGPQASTVKLLGTQIPGAGSVATGLTTKKE